MCDWRGARYDGSWKQHQGQRREQTLRLGSGLQIADTSRQTNQTHRAKINSVKGEEDYQQQHPVSTCILYISHLLTVASECCIIITVMSCSGCDSGQNCNNGDILLAHQLCLCLPLSHTEATKSIQSLKPHLKIYKCLCIEDAFLI